MDNKLVKQHLDILAEKLPNAKINMKFELVDETAKISVIEDVSISVDYMSKLRSDYGVGMVNEAVSGMFNAMMNKVYADHPHLLKR